MSWILNSSTLSPQPAILKNHNGCCNRFFALINAYDENIPKQVVGIGQNGVARNFSRKTNDKFFYSWFWSVYIFSIVLIIFVHVF